MAGPTIIVPPAMPQRSLLSRQPQPHAPSNVASKSRQSTGTMALKGRNTNATTPVAGRKERVNTTRRVCSSNSCTNVLDPGWPWKRCKQCLKGSKGREGRKATNPYMPVVSAAFVCPLCRVYCIFGFAHTGIESVRTTVETVFLVLCGVIVARGRQRTRS